MQQLYKNANAAVGLERLYARLKGELKRLDRERAKAVLETERLLASISAERASRAGQMEKAGATLLLLEPNITLDSIQPIVTTQRLALIPHGGLRSETLSILREHGSWMTSAEIHETLVARTGIVFPSQELKRKHRQTLREALGVMASLDPPRVEREHDLKPGAFIEQRWRLGAMFRE